jgi:predicted deacylase
MSQVVFNPTNIDFDRPGKHTYEIAFHLDATWGYVLLPLTVINGLTGKGKSVACFGGTHGNEYEGQVAIRRLTHELKPDEIRGRVILIPRLNPPACEKRMRESPLDGVNMNRAFPGNPRGTITYRIAHFVTSCIFPRVDVIIDIHAAGEGLEFPLCTSFHLIEDDEQRAEMKKVASLFDTPFIFVYTSEMPGGLLTEEAERLGKIAIGGEFGHSAGVSYKGVLHAYEGIRNVLKHYGMIPGEVTKIDRYRADPPILVQATQLNEYIPAPVSGVYEPVVPVGSWVEADQLLGRLYDFEQVEDEPLEIRAPHDGYLMAHPFRAPISKGDTMIVVARRTD